MNCREARDRLTAIDAKGAVALPATDPVAAHLEGCAACSGFAASLTAARQLLGEHHAGVEPDAAFAARVVAALPGGAHDLLGRAALRLLPAALALVLVLAGWTLIASRRPASLVEQAPTDDLLAWALESQEDAS
jgi:hypothetical protein